MKYLTIAMLMVIASALATPVASAHVKLAAVFSDHMVLQQAMPVSVWGTATANESVTVTITDKTDIQQKTAIADEQGKWMVKLDPLNAGGPVTMTAKGSDTVTIQDILIGEVWIGSGQSNMELPIELTATGTADIASANDPQLRLMKVNRSVEENIGKDIKGTWSATTPESIGPKPASGTTRAVPGVSAVCYYFGRELRSKLNVPVGVIDSSFGGSPAEMWITADGIRSDPAIKNIADRWDQLLANHPAEVARSATENAQWQKDIEAAKAAGKPVPPHPRWIEESRYGGMYNGMIAPLVPLTIRGVIWYQGESNAHDPDTYRVLFPDLIRSWRTAWKRDDLPFIFEQLAGTNSLKPTPTDPLWARLREAQTEALKLPATAMAVAIDIGEPNIHPKDKLDVAHRLALCAEATAYGQPVKYQGPKYAGMSIEGSKIRIHFDHAEGLTAKDMPARLGNVPAVSAGVPKQFAIAGMDRQFVWADATVDGQDVLVSSSAVASPVAVRYAWADNPVCNLTNDTGLPAVPFRTDDWPMPAPATKSATTNR